MCSEDTVEQVTKAQVVSVVGRDIWVDANADESFTVRVRHQSPDFEPFTYAELFLDNKFTSVKAVRALSAKVAIDLGAEGEVKFFGDTSKDDSEAPSITKVWVEGDIMGSKHIVIQVEGSSTEFTLCTLRYSYAYTSNATIRAQAESIVEALGFSEEVEHKTRHFDFSKYR